ncbi:YegP family protein [uncultured Aquimarina sp.]|uniref:YegP family protein n=1 Tax=uncultured Aquimarina sp. TaxID=575652 RepID=UPI002615A5B4|nr:YegP family protein [uncultured Aquimarina sp.]
MANPKFKITKRKNGEFQFNLQAGNGEIIATSEGYSSKQGCEKGIDSVIKNAPIAEIEDLTL